MNQHALNGIQLPKGWLVVSGEEARRLEDELKSELHPDHDLCGCEATAVAQYGPTKGKDVLFKVKQRPHQFYRVHLTYTREKTGDWPAIDGFGSVREFATFSIEEIESQD